MEKENIIYRDTFKMIVAGVENANIYQSLALVLFLIFYISLFIIIYIKPKNYYNKIEKSPLDN